MKLVFGSVDELIVDPLLVTFMLLEFGVGFVLFLHAFNDVDKVLTFRQQVRYFSVVKNIVNIFEEGFVNQLSI